ncbi:MAG: L-histidine N(alpha)-methyltransferase [Microthrixaceae bacterium]
MLLDAGEERGTLQRFALFDCFRGGAAPSRSTDRRRPPRAVGACRGRRLQRTPSRRCRWTASACSPSSAPPSATWTRHSARASCPRSPRRSGTTTGFLLGTDLVKPVEELLPAYDDSRGVTARFNLNALSVMP